MTDQPKRDSKVEHAALLFALAFDLSAFVDWENEYGEPVGLFATLLEESFGELKPPTYAQQMEVITGDLILKGQVAGDVVSIIYTNDDGEHFAIDRDLLGAWYQPDELRPLTVKVSE